MYKDKKISEHLVIRNQGLPASSISKKTQK
jgi:hypothetical protein